MIRTRQAGAMGVAIAALAGAAQASPVVYQFSGQTSQGGYTYIAGAEFTLDGTANTVAVKLTNDTPGAATPSRWLTAVFFDLSGGPDFVANVTAASATHGAQVGNPAGADVLDYWAMKDGISSGAITQSYGFGAAGLDVFNGGTNDIISRILGYNPTPPNLGGVHGGIISNAANPPGGSSQEPMWREFIEFTFQMDPAFFAGGVPAVSNFRLQYGSDLSEPSIVIPLPSGAALAVAGLGLIAFRRRRAG